ncbi:MAG: hypothetical protein JWO19_507 [Bryobacterales bacterium]|nr:hypothetical protein [Bryobacterales bacterium]
MRGYVFVNVRAGRILHSKKIENDACGPMAELYCECRRHRKCRMFMRLTELLTFLALSRCVLAQESIDKPSPSFGPVINLFQIRQAWLLAKDEIRYCQRLAGAARQRESLPIDFSPRRPSGSRIRFANLAATKHEQCR